MTTDTSRWWAKKRLTYNVCLALAGLGAFACYAVVGETACSNNPDFEITAFTTAFQAIGYVVAMVIANVFYGLGPLAERLFEPSKLQFYRHAAFGLGLAFSICLPFLVPAMLFVACDLR